MKNADCDQTTESVFVVDDIQRATYHNVYYVHSCQQGCGFEFHNTNKLLHVFVLYNSARSIVHTYRFY